MSELPTGTVTFLFTDVEGSTRLLHELGNEYAPVLAEHRRIVRGAFGRHGGVEVDTQGDAFFVAFSRASDALAAAVAARDRLSGGPIRVRVGLHTGEPLATDEGYVGIDVHRAARIAAAGHGGQILLSQATRDLVGSHGLRDLGEHRLKDLTAPERIYQVGDGEHPPLKTLNTTNLPIASNPLVGRERELAALTRLLSNGTRVVTLTGPGGSGKTRLGLQVAAELSDEFPGGVFFVPLAEVANADLVEPAITSTVGVRELAELGTRSALIVVDNFEHVLGAAPAITKLVTAGSAARVLVTSRAPLRIGGEQEFQVEPLEQRAAVELLTQRARAIRPDFEPDAAAAAICARLDGLPLALELAASRLRSLGAGALLARLENALPLLTSGQRDVPNRQRTLRATIEWSYDLLPRNLQELLARLAVFAGTFALDSAEAVAGATFEEIDALVEASLLKRVAGDRFLLLETIREFAAERLSGSATGAELDRRHAEHYVDVALSTNLSELSDGTPRHDLATAELPNFRRALESTVREQMPELGFRLMLALEQFWVARDPFEGRRWFERLLAVGAHVDPSLHARALLQHGGLVFIAGDFAAAEPIFAESMAEYRLLGDELGVAHVWSRMVMPAVIRENYDDARAFSRQCLDVYRRLGNKPGEAEALGLLGEVEWRVGNKDLAIRLTRESLELATEVGFDWWRVGTLYTLAEWAVSSGDFAEAEGHAREALALAHRIGDRQHRVYLFALLARCAIESSRMREAGTYWAAVELDEQGRPVGQWESERAEYASPILDRADDDFADGRQLGARKTLDELVAFACAS
ncbi:MAG: ATP-binding protein [Gaiellaceae bacterium]